ncbi:MAG TPA: hypothetical protein VGD39_15900 [Nocardioides sp.]|jgi:hypothetical protein
MNHEPHGLVRRLVGGDAGAEADVVALARAGTDDVPVLVAAAVVAHDVVLLDAAAGLARQPRDRQLTALGRALLDADVDLFDALVRDHLATYPDQLLAAWLAARPR